MQVLRQKQGAWPLGRVVWSGTGTRLANSSSFGEAARRNCGNQAQGGVASCRGGGRGGQSSASSLQESHGVGRGSGHTWGRKRKHYLCGPTRTPSSVCNCLWRVTQSRRGKAVSRTYQNKTAVIRLALCLLNQAAQCRSCWYYSDPNKS